VQGFVITSTEHTVSMLRAETVVATMEVVGGSHFILSAADRGEVSVREASNVAQVSLQIAAANR
jgi:hypothetical protein